MCGEDQTFQMASNSSNSLNCLVNSRSSNYPHRPGREQKVAESFAFV